MPSSTSRADHIWTLDPHRAIAAHRHRALPRPTPFHQLTTRWTLRSFVSISHLGLGSHRDLLLNQLGPKRIQPLLYCCLNLSKRRVWMSTAPAFYFLKVPAPTSCHDDADCSVISSSHLE